jgi:hypothetical protein
LANGIAREEILRIENHEEEHTNERMAFPASNQSEREREIGKIWAVESRKYLWYSHSVK